MGQRIWVLTMFPRLFDSFCESGVVGQALRGERGGARSLIPVLISDFCPKGYKGVDDHPYGGGAGMVMRADALKNALFKGVIEAGGYGDNWREKLLIICPDAKGTLWDNHLAQKKADSWFQGQRDLLFICGRYRGIDQRFLDNYVDEHLSVGNYILSGGELAVMVLIESTLRLVPGTLGNDLSHKEESFSDQLLEHPLYTRPQEFEGKKVPAVLLSGNHQMVRDYLQEERQNMTRKKRPDLISQ